MTEQSSPAEVTRAVGEALGEPVAALPQRLDARLKIPNTPRQSHGVRYFRQIGPLPQLVTLLTQRCNLRVGCVILGNVPMSLRSQL